MKSYLKFLSRNKLYAAIMAAGLIVSLAFVVLISNYVRHQWRMAKGDPSLKQIYAVGATYGTVEAAPDGMANLLKEEVPGIELASMYDHFGFFGRIGGKLLNNLSLAIVEPDFFKMFPTEWVQGDFTSIHEGEIAINEHLAQQLFEGRSPIGEMVGRDSMIITAVFKSLGGTILRDADLLRVRELKTLQSGYAGGSTCLISSSRQEEDLARTIDQVLETHARMRFNRDETREFKNGSIERLDRIYFSELNSGRAFFKGNLSLMRILIAVVLLLLLSAMFNYINLSTALAGRRTKETGTRTILGATRGQVFSSYIVESLVFTCVCALFALVLAYAFTPILSNYVETKQGSDILSVPFAWHWDVTTVAATVLLILLLGFLAGLIPARTASRYNPAQIIKGDYRLRSKRVFSKVFIVFQSAFSVLLVSLSLIMERQFSHMIHRPVGADVANIYVQNRLSDAHEDAISQLSFVKEIGHSHGYPGSRYMSYTAQPTHDETPIRLEIINMDKEAFAMCNFEVVEDFHNPSGRGVWLSESAFKGLNLIPGESKVPERLSFLNEEQFAGVLKDFAVTDAAHVEPTEYGVIQVEHELEDANLLIQIDGDKKEAGKQLAQVYKKFSEEKYGMEYFPQINGFINDKLRDGLEEAEKHIRLIEIFMILSVLVSLLGLLAMSAFFAAERTHDVAVRKVFGGTVSGEVAHGVKEYMWLVLIACVIAVPEAVWGAGRYLEDFNYRISNYGWVFAVGVIITLAISFLSVLWQTLKAARTNPAEELKKE